ncbi:DUF2203 domain-containing protein [soil metagenome]
MLGGTEGRRVSERLFDVEEAESLLPMLRELLPRVRESRRALIGASERITAAVQADGGGVAGGDWFAAQEALRVDLTALADAGVLLRDPETGLVDFPAQRDDRRVFLCWRLCEERVGWFHGEHGGYSRRHPL